MLLVSLTIPNLDPTQLEWFLKTNWSVLKKDVLNQILELIVVSSAIDTHLTPLSKRYPKIKFIQLKKPSGFARTVNTGFHQASEKTQWLGTVNDDVTLSSNWLKNLLAGVINLKKIGSINPVILTPQATVESAGIEVLPIGKAKPITNIPNKPTIVSATNAACVLYRALALEEVGFFDEKFESYLEDIDLSLRLKRAGWSNLVIPSVSVIHQRHTTSKKSLTPRRRAWLNLRNWWYILFKNWSANLWLKYLPSILLERGRNLSGWLKAKYD